MGRRYAAQPGRPTIFRVFPAGRPLSVFAAAVLLAVPVRVLAPSPVACAPAIADEKITESAEERLAAGERVLAAYLARRFVLVPEAVALVVSAAHRAAQEVGLDPLLVLAVISVESSFNPIAESAMGAKGLMQIIPRYHRAKLLEAGGEEAVLDPEANIHVGVRILQEYVYRRGTLEAGLQYYNGASADGSAQYAQKVMSERVRLEQVLRTGLRRQAFQVAAAAGG
jgi:soluble lytic murein transglycosylase-like protein